MNKKRVAHFLNTIHLRKSPPNDAIERAYQENDVDVDFFSNSHNDEDVQLAFWGVRWLLTNMLKPHWRHYSAFSATSEDPIVIAGVLAFIWRKPLIFLSDEIKSGSYVGDRSSSWKRVCRWLMRRASLTIVNDETRIKLQRDYASLSNNSQVIVYPGCFLNPPKTQNRKQIRSQWGIPEKTVVLGFSGGCNLTAGIDWALDALSDHRDIHMVAQPLALDSLNRYFLENHQNIKQVYLEQERLSWQDSWSSMGGVDIGVAVYLNQSPQFQLMGISSNRLCMFLAMGVPVIVSKQDSFSFIEDYNCGVMVSNAKEFSDAVALIKSDLDNMKANALKCTEEYIDTKGKFRKLVSEVGSVLSS